MTDSFNPAAGFAQYDLSETRRQSAIAGWFAAFVHDDAASDRYLLLLRFTMLNVIALALLGTTCTEGWVPLMVAGDTTGPVLLIGALFLLGLVCCGCQSPADQRDADRHPSAAACAMPPHGPGSRFPSAADVIALVGLYVSATQLLLDHPQLVDRLVAGIYVACAYAIAAALGSVVMIRWLVGL